MTEHSNYPGPATLGGQPGNRRLSIVVFALTAVALLAVLGVYASIPEPPAKAPPEAAQAIRDL